MCFSDKTVVLFPTSSMIKKVASVQRNPVFFHPLTGSTCFLFCLLSCMLKDSLSPLIFLFWPSKLPSFLWILLSWSSFSLSWDDEEEQDEEQHARVWTAASKATSRVCSKHRGCRTSVKKRCSKFPRIFKREIKERATWNTCLFWFCLCQHEITALELDFYLKKSASVWSL